MADTRSAKPRARPTRSPVRRAGSVSPVRTPLGRWDSAQQLVHARPARRSRSQSIGGRGRQGGHRSGGEDPSVGESLGLEWDPTSDPKRTAPQLGAVGGSLLEPEPGELASVYQEVVQEIAGQTKPATAAVETPESKRALVQSVLRDVFEKVESPGTQSLLVASALSAYREQLQADADLKTGADSAAGGEQRPTGRSESSWASGTETCGHQNPQAPTSEGVPVPIGGWYRSQGSEDSEDSTDEFLQT
jgi:hypothetical protein